MNLRSGHVEALPIEQWLCQSVFQKTNYCLYPVLCKYLITITYETYIHRIPFHRLLGQYLQDREGLVTRGISALLS
jgi:hypothetical protein